MLDSRERVQDASDPREGLRPLFSNLVATPTTSFARDADDGH
jgi:hypothetical protein